MKTFTDKGAIKQAITDPLGSRVAAESVSVTIAKDQQVTPDTRAILGSLELINDTLNKILLALN